MNVLNVVADWWNDLILEPYALPISGVVADWWKDSYQEFYTLLISGLVLAMILGVWRLIFQVRPNSAKAKHKDPKKKCGGRHQLYYPSLKFKAVGYDDQLSALNRFLKIEESFRWCLVKGEGGTGKSKLCYDFMRSKQRKWWKPWGWEPCMPEAADKGFTTEILNACSKH